MAQRRPGARGRTGRPPRTAPGVARTNMMYHWFCMLSHDSGMSIMSMRMAPTASETMNFKRMSAHLPAALLFGRRARLRRRGAVLAPPASGSPRPPPPWRSRPA